MPVDRSIMLFNGKGGVGKSSIAANLAGLVALGGWRVLVVDLDKQGNLARDFGCMEVSDDGEGILRAAISDATLKPIMDVRPNLDFIPGGRKLRDAVEALPRNDLTWLDRALAPLSDDYDLVVIDSPPGIWQLQDAAAAVAGFVLVPTKVDDASVDGLAEVADELTMIRERYNPDVTVLGVVLTLVGSRHVRVIRRARERLAGLLGDSGVKIYDPVIRESVVAGIEGTRNMGRLAHEYEAVAAHAAPWWKRLRTDADDAEPVSKAAGGLAQDYQDLTDAVMRDVIEHLTERVGITRDG
jgi:chromosome partitioning protein